MLNIGFVTLAKSNVPCLWRKRCCTCTSTVAYLLQLNEYETAPNFIQLSQNLTSDCLLNFVFLPVFTSFCMIKLFFRSKQNNDHIMQKLVKTQKSTNNLMSSFGLIEENMELSHIHLAVSKQISYCPKKLWRIRLFFSV